MVFTSENKPVFLLVCTQFLQNLNIFLGVCTMGPKDTLSEKTLPCSISIVALLENKYYP